MAEKITVTKADGKVLSVKEFMQDLKVEEITDELAKEMRYKGILIRGLRKDKCSGKYYVDKRFIHNVKHLSVPKEEKVERKNYLFNTIQIIKEKGPIARSDVAVHLRTNPASLCRIWPSLQGNTAIFKTMGKGTRYDPTQIELQEAYKEYSAEQILELLGLRKREYRPRVDVVQSTTEEVVIPIRIEIVVEVRK